MFFVLFTVYVVDELYSTSTGTYKVQYMCTVHNKINSSSVST